MSVTFPIAYVAGQFPLRSETFVWREVRELRRRGWPVHTFGLRAPSEETPAELADLRQQTTDVYDLGQARPTFTHDLLAPGEPMGPKQRAKLAVQKGAGHLLAAELKRLGVRHVHAHFAHAPATVAMYAARKLGIGFSFTGHANDLFQRRHLLKRKLERAGFVACISEWHRALYCSIHPGGTYHVIRCGVPMEQYDVAPPPPLLPAGPLRILTLARLVEKKGIDRLLRAAAQVDGVHITVAGDGPERAKLEAVASAGRMRFVGSVDSSAVPGLLAEHHAFALPCRQSSAGDRDGIPVVLMEAMAARRAVVAGDLPAIGELIEDGQTGRLVPFAHEGQAVAVLAAILREWRDEPRQLANLGEAGRRRVEQEFSLAGNVDRLTSAIEQAGGGR